MKKDRVLSGRQKNVLTAIVDRFIAKAEPVSSKLISMNPDLAASAATIRNTMAELEDLGLLEQPHTSAGRKPTDQGYRTYINELLCLESLPEEEKRLIDSELGKEQDENELLAQTARVLGRLTNLLGLALSPSFKEEPFNRLSLVPLAETRFMLVLSASDMVFRTTLFESALDTSIYRIEATARRLNDLMRGKPVSYLNDFLQNQSQNPNSSEELRAIQFLERSISKLVHERLEHVLQYFGTKNMLMQPDFEDLGEIAPVLDLLESRQALVRFLRELATREGVQTTIGEEIQDGQKFQSIAVITSTYRHGGASGIIGVIGPKRMPYARVIPLVEYTAGSLTRRHASREGAPWPQ